MKNKTNFRRKKKMKKINLKLDLNPAKAEQREIKVSELKPSPHNQYQIEDIFELKNSIANCGLLSPISVIKDEIAGDYIILSGERRWTAVKELIEDGIYEKDTIPCYVVGDNTMSVLHQKYIIEAANLETREFNREAHRFNFLQILSELCESGELKSSEATEIIAEQFKISPRYGRSYQRVFNTGSDRLKEMLLDNKITARPAENILAFKEEDQEEILDAIEAGEKADAAVEAKKIEIAGKNKVIISEEYLDELDLDDLDDVLGASSNSNVDLEIDSSMLYKGLKNSASNDDSAAKYESKLNTMLQWCEQVVKKQKLSEKETEVLIAMESLIEKFL